MSDNKFYMLKKIALSLLTLWLFSGCLKSKETGGNACTYDTCAAKAPATEVQAVESYLASKSITNAVKHCSGVYYIIQDPGTGAKPTPCSSIVAKYKGELSNGTVFDPGPQFTQYYALTSLIRGWTVTIPMIGLNGKMRLFIPPSLGYGNSTPPGSNIPPNSMLIFDIELIAFQ
jgi:FKBP-type peptidyl-prolyl cis-trans isomerase FkpA